MDPQARTFNKPLFILFAIGSLAAVFFLPYFIAQAPSTSHSWTFAYNNRAGIFILLVSIAIGVFWSRGMGLELPEPGRPNPLPKWILACALATVLCGYVAKYFSAGIYGGWGEANYFVGRVWLLDQGKLPYVDFEYAYGVLFLYGPLSLHRLCNLGVAQAYYLFCLLIFLTGTVLLFKVISDSNYPSNVRNNIFLILFIPGTLGILALGANYTFFRFVCPLYFISLFQRALLEGRAPSKLRAQLIAFACTMILLLISPETAIAFAFACAALFACSVYSAAELNRATLISFAGLLLQFAFIFSIARRVRILDTVMSANSNANSFPIAIAPHIVLYCGSLFLCSCFLFVRISQMSLPDLNIGFILVSIPMVAAALGRCDPAHVFWNGLGVFISTLFYFSSDRFRYRRYRMAFLAFLFIIPTLTGSLIGIHRPESGTKRPADSISVDSLYPFWHTEFLAPFGFTPNGMGTTLSARIDYGRYDGTINNDSQESIEETISEMRNNPNGALLLRQGFEGQCETNPAGERLAISLLFGFPYFGRTVHSESIRKPICDFINANYQIMQPPDAQNFNYGLWVRKPVQTTQESAIAHP